jgi:hypothetical protein
MHQQLQLRPMAVLLLLLIILLLLLLPPLDVLLVMLLLLLPPLDVLLVMLLLLLLLALRPLVCAPPTLHTFTPLPLRSITCSTTPLGLSTDELQLSKCRP